MKKLLDHFIEKLFATKIATPCRNSLQDVAADIEHLKKQYESIGMKLIDISYEEHIKKCHSRDNNGELWLTKTYMSYAMLYFIKDN